MMTIRHFILFFNICIILFFSTGCDNSIVEDYEPSLNELLIQTKKNNGIYNSNGEIISRPSVTLSITSSDNRYELTPFDITYRIFNRTYSFRNVYLDLETNTSTLELLNNQIISEVINSFPQNSLSFLVKGTVNAIHPESKERIIIPFEETVWMDTGKEVTYSVSIGTPQGRYTTEKHMLPWEYTGVDTLIITYAPSDVFFICSGKLTQDTKNNETTNISIKENDCDGILKIPFNVYPETSKIDIRVTIENSCKIKAVTENYEIAAFPAESEDDMIGTVWQRNDRPNEIIEFFKDFVRIYILEPGTNKIKTQTTGKYSFTNGTISWNVELYEIEPYDYYLPNNMSISYNGVISGNSITATRLEYYDEFYNETTCNYTRINGYNTDILRSIYIPEAVDIGMVIDGKKILWASWNLGALKEEDSGDFYTWGDIVPSYSSKKGKNKNHSGGYIFEGDDGKYTKYNEIDNAASLADYDYVDDAARQQLGYPWRIPTVTEVEELFLSPEKYEITITKTGTVITSIIGPSQGNNIFLPKVSTTSDYKYYWTSTRLTEYPLTKNAYYFSHDGVSINSYYNTNQSYTKRDAIYAIRPVMTVEQ